MKKVNTAFNTPTNDYKEEAEMSIIEREEKERNYTLSLSLQEKSLSLKVVEKTTIYKVEFKKGEDNAETLYSKTKIREEESEKQYPFRRVTKAQLWALRGSDVKVPSLVLKKGDKLYWAKIPKGLSLQGLNLYTHKCGMCRRLSPLPEDQGGCLKVARFATGIEDFDFVLEGYESFNTNHDVFVVGKCSSYEPERHRPKPEAKQRNEARIALAQFIDPNVENIKDVNRLKWKGRKVPNWR